MMRSNLVRLMSGPSPESEAAGDTKDGGDNLGDERRRRLIVDLDPPQFGRFTGLLDVPGTLIGWAGDRYGAAAGAAGAIAPKGAITPRGVISPYQAGNVPPPNQRNLSHGGVVARPVGGNGRHQAANAPPSRWQRQSHGGGIARPVGPITPQGGSARRQTAVAPQQQQQQMSRGEVRAATSGISLVACKTNWQPRYFRMSDGQLNTLESRFLTNQVWTTLCADNPAPCVSVVNEMCANPSLPNADQLDKHVRKKKKEKSVLIVTYDLPVSSSTLTSQF